MADYNINAITRRVVYTGSAGLGPYAFSFEIIDQDDVGVYFNQTALTLSSDYTVTINANGTGSVTIITGGNVPSTPTANDTIIIIGARDIERTTDFVTAGDLLASSLNEQLDSNIIFEQQIDERVDRSIKFPVFDSFTGDNVLPAAAARADKILKFDNAGNVAVESASALVGGAVVGANFTNNTFTGDGSQTAFTTTVEAGSKNNAQVYIDGVYQLKSSFSVSANTLTFTEAPPLNSQIEVIIGNAIDTVDADSGNVNYNQGGTGAQTRTVESKLQEFVSVKDFGATGDGVTDDTAAIKTAFQSIGSSGGTIYFPSGTYKIDTQHRTTAASPHIEDYFFGIENNNTHVYAHESAFIDVVSATGKHANLFSITATSNVVIDNIRAEGIAYSMTDAGDAETTGGIYYGFRIYNASATTNHTDFKITNCNLKYCLRGGINQVVGTLTNGVFDSNTFRYVRGHAIAITNASECKITKNQIYKQQTFRQNPYVSGSTFGGLGVDVSNNSTRCTVQNNVVNDCVFGIKTERDELAGDISSEHKILDNTIVTVNENEQYGSGASSYGIKISSDRTTVSGNVIQNCYAKGILVNNGQANHLIISENILDGFLSKGIEIKDADTAGTDVERDNVIISNNSIYGQIPTETRPTEGIDCAGAELIISNNIIKEVDSGISLRAGAHNADVSNNKMRSVNTGIFLFGADAASYEMTEVSVTNNDIETEAISSSGIIVTYADRLTIVGNKIFSSINATSGRGIYITNSANDRGSNLINNNYCRNYFRGIQVSTVTDVIINSNNVFGYNSSDRGINLLTCTNALIVGNLVNNAAQGIVTQVDGAGVFIDSNNTSGSTSGITSTSATLGTNV